MDCQICSNGGQITEASKLVILKAGDQVPCCDECAKVYEPYLLQDNEEIAVERIETL